MNIVELHKEIHSINDIVESPRFETWQIDQAINYASKVIVKNRYDKALMENKSQRSLNLMRLRDELYTIVKKQSTEDNPATIELSDDIITIGSLPDRYIYTLAVKFKINNLQEDFASFITYPELPVLNNNPFRRPSKTYPYKFYYLLSSLGIELIYGKHSSDEVTEAELYYLDNPVDVNYGTTITTSTAAFVEDKNCIAQADGTSQGTTTYKEGEEFTLTAGSQLAAGSASINYVSSDLPEILHTELAQEAAKWLELKIKDFDKWKALEEKEMIDKR